MSYDLYFRAHGLVPSTADVLDYFRGRSNYEVSEQQATYSNDITGVYFVFDAGDPGLEDDPPVLPLSFNLNYFRPHIFGLEAEVEVRTLVAHFDLSVSDPQVNGIGDGEYHTEKFLSGWNAGNEFAYQSIISRNPEEPLLNLPTEQIDACWRWNFLREQLQGQLGEDVFVPRFIFVLHEGTLKTAVVWPDGIPIAIPESDLVIIPRKDILPRRFFRSSEDIVIAEWPEVGRLVGGFPLEQAALPYRLLQYSEIPAELISQLRNLDAAAEKPEGVAVDKILNAELIEKVRAR
jgi:hypothetical protein